MQIAEFRIQGVGCGVEGQGCMVQDLEDARDSQVGRQYIHLFQHLGFRVQGSGFRVQGSGCRVRGSGGGMTWARVKTDCSCMSSCASDLNSFASSVCRHDFISIQIGKTYYYTKR